ncbi:hypothetical protein CCACVL1_08715 [Corchorus capsularis]|uniref:Uncharacterized protein n=1 Tax=Corchorus capsularis TaxID=210143 RepID=A0A1R3IZ77_COCAP|nr:hypothetical protein CCACVL1_08715 [Corchorus capsularis]
MEIWLTGKSSPHITALVDRSHQHAPRCPKGYGRSHCNKASSRQGGKKQMPLELELIKASPPLKAM